jgi:hypothetical protein
MNLENHKDQIKDKLKQYEKAEHCVDILRGIKDDIEYYLSGNNSTVYTIQAINELFNKHSECTRFMEKSQFIYDSAEVFKIPKLLENIMDPAKLISEYVNDVMSKVTQSIFTPSTTLASSFFDMGALIEYIMKNYTNPHSFSCIHKIGQLYLMVDKNTFEINWVEFFNTWKDICDIEITILTDYMSSITIDDIYDSNKTIYWRTYTDTELWPYASVFCQSYETEDIFYTGDIFMIDGNPYIFTGVMRSTLYSDGEKEYIYRAILRCDKIDDEKVVLIETSNTDCPFNIGEGTTITVNKMNLESMEVVR